MEVWEFDYFMWSLQEVRCPRRLVHMAPQLRLAENLGASQASFFLNMKSPHGSSHVLSARGSPCDCILISSQYEGLRMAVSSMMAGIQEAEDRS